MANYFEPWEMKRRNLSPERQKNADEARAKLAARPYKTREIVKADPGFKLSKPWQRDVRETEIGPRSLRSELEANLKQFTDEFHAGRRWLFNAGKKSKYPRVAKTTEDIEAGLNVVITRATPTVQNLYQKAQAGNAWVNQWVGGRFEKVQPHLKRGATTLTDKARPLLAGVQKSVLTNTALAHSWTVAKYTELKPGVSDIAFRAAYKTVDTTSRIAAQGRALESTMSEAFPRLGEGIGTVRRGGGATRDLLSPTASALYSDAREGFFRSRQWASQGYGEARAAVTKFGEDPMGAVVLFKDKVALGAAEMAARFRHMGPIPRWGALGLGVAAASAWLWGAAQARTGPDANIPPNYVPGQQGAKVISVPWASPYQGSATDEATAYQNNILKLSPLAIPFVAQRIYGRLGPKTKENIWLATRFLEDATPMRIGRIFGLSGKFSSFLTPEELNVPIERMLAGKARLSPYGATFSRAMNMPEPELAALLHGQLNQGSQFLKFTKQAKTPFMKLEIEGMDMALRFYESTSRFAQSFALLGAAEAHTIPNISRGNVELRLRQMMGLSPDPRDKGKVLTSKLDDLQAKIYRFAYKNVPGGKQYLRRVASIPQWDKNDIKTLQRMGLEQDMWIPGYMSGKRGAGRVARGVLFDFMRSSWGLLRTSAAKIGVNIGPATSLTSMAKKAGKAGVLTAAAIGGFSYINETLHGALTAPLWNVYERARLLQARISDRLGFTDTRKQHPHVFPWSAAAVLTLPLFALGGAKYIRRATTANTYEMVGTYRRMAAGANLQWDKGGSMPLRELPFARSAARMETKLARHPWISKKVLDPRTGRNVRELTKLAKYGPLILGGFVAKWFAPFILGTKYSEKEYSDIFSGKKEIPVQKGRFWEFGNTPYEGGRISYFRLHQAARRKIDAEQHVEGSGRRSILKAIFNPYWREKESYNTRPYPITSTPFEEIPFFGPILARTLGRFFKPPKLMHTKEWQAGQEYEPFGPDMAPNRELGGLRAPTPKDPLGWRAQIREGVYRGTEFMGLRGFFFQSMLFEHAFGGQAPYAQAHTLQPARFKSFTKHWYDSEVGGMAGSNELFRRLFPRPQRGTEVNPLKNQMPSWMPGENYFINFKEGDPYSKIPYGESRLPGGGFEARYPQLKGLSQEDYPSWARFQILADVAPWSVEVRKQRAAAYSEYGDDPRFRAKLEEIDWQIEQVKKRKDFSNYDFNRDLDTVSGRVSEILPGGQFRLEEFPNHVFAPAGLRFGVAASSQRLREINGWTKEKADQKAFEQSGEAEQYMADQLLGAQVKLKIGRGGLNRPDVEARIFANGVNFNRELAQRGLAAPSGSDAAATASPMQRLFGKVIEGIGHIPQKVPGPFFMFSKFYNEADPIEEYQRSELYGSSSRMWNKPWENFLRPYIQQTIAKLTPGEFVPGSTQKKRDVDMLFDRLAYIKDVNSGGMGSRTAAGVNVLGDERQVISTMPYRERPYMQEFVKETDPRRRSQILSMVSEDMQRALAGQWTKQYAQATGSTVQSQGGSSRIQATMAMATEQIHNAGYVLPGKDWVGWDQRVQMEDVKAIFLRSEGYDNHDFNIWNDRMTTLERKPYLKGSHEYLTSRPLDLNINILSSGHDRRSMGGLSVVGEHTSRSLASTTTIYNASNRKAQDEAQYLEASDSLLGS